GSTTRHRELPPLLAPCSARGPALLTGDSATGFAEDASEPDLRVPELIQSAANIDNWFRMEFGQHPIKSP
ncbi:MAG TPA: hypothetical protein VGG24_14635, partial [Paraburkholderia sp.]